MVEELVLKWEEMFHQLIVDEEGMGGVIYYDEEGKPISQKEAMETF
jgi:hypothetical protein